MGMWETVSLYWPARNFHAWTPGVSISAQQGEPELNRALVLKEVSCGVLVLWVQICTDA